MRIPCCAVRFCSNCYARISFTEWNAKRKSLVSVVGLAVSSEMRVCVLIGGKLHDLSLRSTAKCVDIGVVGVVRMRVVWEMLVQKNG